jgi:peptide/nickel transport system permease protein
MLVAASVFALIVFACIAAPLYAKHVAHSGPDDNHVSDSIKIDGRTVPVISSGKLTTTATGELQLQPGGVPIGPQWFSVGGRFVLGADQNGRDVAVRLLYGGRTSLLISFAVAAIAMFSATGLALMAGYYGGWIDAVISRFLDTLWAIPGLLLGVALGTALSLNGIDQFGIRIPPGSLLLPILALCWAPIAYVGRPLRAQLRSVRQREFVDAAVVAGASTPRILIGELLPNIMSTILIMTAIVAAMAIIFEASLSFLGAGVQPPTASWGSLVAEGQSQVRTAPWISLAPGLALFVTVLTMNAIADGLRDALDPKATRGRRHR